MTGFVQIIEFKTDRVEDVRALVEQAQEDLGGGTALRGTVCADRERPGYYFNVVEFETYESAMSNSQRPEVVAFAAAMAALCEGTPRFYNLDVVEAWSAEGTSTSTKAAVLGAAAAVVGAAATGVTKARQQLQERRAQRSSSTRVTVASTADTVSPPVLRDTTDTAKDVDSGTPRGESPPPS